MKVLVVLSQTVAATSTKLSVAAVLGLAALPALPHDAASTMGALPVPAAAIEMVNARAVPLLGAAPDSALELVARRNRPKRESRTRAEEAPQKTEAVAPAPAAPEPDKAPATAATPKTDVPQAEPPKPDLWSDAQVIAALRECVRLLAPIAADVEVSEPVKQDQCGAAAPVLLRRVGSGAAKVEISPPAVVNCAMVVGLHAWVEKTLQPAAQEVLGSPITRLRNASGYSCRNRIGSLFHSDRLSEHALANAMDIAGFVTADGRTVDVARAWGPTARDEREAQKLTAAAAKPVDKSVPSKSERPANRKVSAIATAAVEPRKNSKRKGPVQTAELQKAGKSASDAGADARANPVPPAEARNTAEARFLRRLHKGACGVFGTVLGPEANEAHRDHFHFDLAHRRHSALCQ